MQLTKSQQKRLLEIAVSDLYVGERLTARQIFDAIADSGRDVRGYHHFLERVARALKRAQAGINAMEAE